MTMNTRTLTIIGLCLSLAACASGPLTAREKGTLAGGALGAGTGALVGRYALKHKTAEGAAIGGAAGALGGWIIGDQVDAASGGSRYDDRRYDRYDDRYGR
jgi:osmotically inducible lipoprotein OsmB